MADTVFRTQSQGTTSPPPADIASKSPHTAPEAQIPVPYTDYKTQNGHPYTVDYFKLGNTWEDVDGGFYKEVDAIENYIHNQIEKGEIATWTSSMWL